LSFAIRSRGRRNGESRVGGARVSTPSLLPAIATPRDRGSAGNAHRLRAQQDWRERLSIRAATFVNNSFSLSQHACACSRFRWILRESRREFRERERHFVNPVLESSVISRRATRISRQRTASRREERKRFKRRGIRVDIVGFRFFREKNYFPRRISAATTTASSFTDHANPSRSRSRILNTRPRDIARRRESRACSVTTPRSSREPRVSRRTRGIEGQTQGRRLIACLALPAGRGEGRFLRLNHEAAKLQAASAGTSLSPARGCQSGEDVPRPRATLIIR